MEFSRWRQPPGYDQKSFRPSGTAEMRMTYLPPHLQRETSFDQSPVAYAHRLNSDQASGFRF
jgi:hypothetical protein